MIHEGSLRDAFSLCCWSKTIYIKISKLGCFFRFRSKVELLVKLKTDKCNNLTVVALFCVQVQIGSKAAVAFIQVAEPSVMHSCTVDLWRFA